LRPLILLSNDDGYFAPGLRALRDALAKDADVIVCAPEANQSATSHSLSLHRVLRLRAVEPGVFAVDGTPADCVYVALHSGTRVLPRRPDLVVSGMNHGLNLGVDVFYSGTVAAAREGALRGIPAIAVSADSGAKRAAAAALGATIALALLKAAGPSTPPVGGAAGESGALGTDEATAIVSALHAPLLNVNIPPGEGWRVRGTRLGARLYTQDVVFREDPRGKEYLWIGGADVRHDPVPGSDTEAFDEGWASVTPLTLDLFASEHAALAAGVAAQAAQSVLPQM
jgi:5'-nucleotidase